MKESSKRVSILGWVGSLKELLIIEEELINIKNNIIEFCKSEIDEVMFNHMKNNEQLSHNEIISIRQSHINKIKNNTIISITIKYDGDKKRSIKNETLKSKLETINLKEITEMKFELISEVNLIEPNYSALRVIVIKLSLNENYVYSVNSKNDDFTDRILHKLQKNKPKYIRFKEYILFFVTFSLYIWGIQPFVEILTRGELFMLNMSVSMIMSLIATILIVNILDKKMPLFEVFENSSNATFKNISLIFLTIVIPLALSLLSLLLPK